MSRKQTILKGTFILTLTGIISRIMGFFYRIFLSQTFGESGIGLYQLIFPIYALAFSFSSAGIELALSRCVSKYLTLGNQKKAKEMLYTSIIISMTLSIFCTLFLQRYAYSIAQGYLRNLETVELLLILSYTFPFASLHSCIVGYYLGMKRTKIASISQLFEQAARILSVLVLFKFSSVFQFNFSISFAVVGLVFGELSSAVFCLKSLKSFSESFRTSDISLHRFYKCSIELLSLSLPVTGSRVLLNILQSIEAVSIPLSLKRYGLNTNEALSVYGVLTGMALPFILFPSAITNAVSTMLLPTVSEVHVLKDNSTLIMLFKKTFLSCTLLGSLCCILFLLSGNFAGDLLFESSLAGEFIVTLAWICPFLYTNNTLISIINGMGKTIVSFFINVLSLSIRIFSVFQFIPSSGIYGYLIGLLLSQLFTFGCCLLFLFKQFKAKVT